MVIVHRRVAGWWTFWHRGHGSFPRGSLHLLHHAIAIIVISDQPAWKFGLVLQPSLPTNGCLHGLSSTPSPVYFLMAFFSFFFLSQLHGKNNVTVKYPWRDFTVSDGSQNRSAHHHRQRGFMLPFWGRFCLFSFCMVFRVSL